jgi:hypothetical protein
MSADDKLDILKEMAVLIGRAVLQGEQRTQFERLCVRYEELASKPKSVPKRPAKTTQQKDPLPDIYAEYNSRSQDDFLHWASTLKIAVLKQLVKEGQFDPAGRSAKWRKADKFGELIYQQLQSRAGRGDGFGRIVSGMTIGTRKSF